jgi:hypothetical protein
MKRLALIVALLAGLAGAASATTPNINGVYQTKITGKSPAILNATWLLSIAQSRAFAVARNGTTVIGGKLTIAGSKLTFHDVTGPMACTGAQATGVYTYTLNGKTLKLRKVKDSCVGRSTVLSSTFTWVHAPVSG